jgi:hypothetical protein
MISRTYAGLLVWVLAAVLIGCEHGRSAVPTVPSPPSVPAAPTLIVFAEPDPGLSWYANITGATQVDEVRRP